MPVRGSFKFLLGYILLNLATRDSHLLAILRATLKGTSKRCLLPLTRKEVGFLLVNQALGNMSFLLSDREFHVYVFLSIQFWRMRLIALSKQQKGTKKNSKPICKWLLFWRVNSPEILQHMLRFWCCIGWLVSGLLFWNSVSPSIAQTGLKFTNLLP